MIFNIVITVASVVVAFFIVFSLIRLNKFGKVLDAKLSEVVTKQQALIAGDTSMTYQQIKAMHPWIDVSASYAKFDISRPWDFNFEKMVVYYE